MARTPVETLFVVAVLATVSPAQAKAPAPKRPDASALLAAAPKKDKGSDAPSADKSKDTEADKSAEKKEPAEADAKPPEEEPKAEKSKDKASKDGAGDAAEDEAPDAFREERNKTYRWLGLRARAVVIPSFVFGLFGAKGGKTVVSPQVGAELAIRRNDFEYDLWLTYARYALGDTAFKASNDPENAWEIVSASLNTLTIGSDFLWSHRFNHKVQFVYGIGAGLSMVFGNLYRTQAYPRGGGFEKCSSPNNPSIADSTGTQYCHTDNDHYNGYKEPSWASGGQKPLIIPWISPFLVGVRWKPHPRVALRFEMGIAMPGPFFFGTSGQFGL